MAKERILVVDDEKDILELISFNLEKEGYIIRTAGSGEQALQKIDQEIPDLLVLDLMLPGIDGLEVCRTLKQQKQTKYIPIIMVSAKSEDHDVVIGLELGADDYITKPFSPKVLIARVRAALRKSGHQNIEKPESPIVLGDLNIDPIRHEVTYKGEFLDLSATEFSILEFLGRSPGWVFSRNQIINAVKGQDYPVTERSVDVQVLGLRKKLKEAGSMVETVRGVGYRMKDSKK
ncbi:MAG: response regulator [Spirochaetia bacterium]